MITEDYVSFETAKLLKEKGFDEPCLSYFWSEGIDTSYTEIPFTQNNMYEGQTLRPTLQMTMKWLRKVHHYYIQVMLDSWACEGHLGYYVVIQKTDSDFEMMLQDVGDEVFYDEVFYQTYEEACKAAIKYCLKNLI